MIASMSYHIKRLRERSLLRSELNNLLAMGPEVLPPEHASRPIREALSPIRKKARIEAQLSYVIAFAL
jgi:hypothetical protein